MNLEKIIGQLFIIGFRGASVDGSHPIAADIQERNLGGVILFDQLLARGEKENNIINPSQVRELSTSLQQFSSSPLLIAVDQEGGRVRRLKPERGFPATESAAELGEKDDPVRTALHAAATAQTLAELGININFAPVVDLNVFPENPVIGKLERSFSAVSDTVIRHAAIWINEHKKRNILSCLKHFPGHGSSRHDSHKGFTDISSSWQREELTPFTELIRQDGGELVDSVMLGHLFHHSFDEKLPTSLSPAISQDLLRRQLGFKGVIITDDLQMKAITDTCGLEESVCLALAAGVDMIIVGNNLEYDPGFLQRAVSAVLLAIEENRITEDRIFEAWQHVKEMRRLLN